ncbi:MAG: ester cyclase [Candidatus Dormibacteraceae bacterium]
MVPTPHELYRLWLLELWQGKLDIAEELIAEEFVGHWPDRDIRGRRELVKLISQTREAVEDLTFQLEVGPIAEGDLIAARWTGCGRSAEGHNMRFFGNDLLRIYEGRFAEYWVASSVGS